MAPEQYYQLDPNMLFSPPSTSVARFSSPVYAALPLPRTAVNGAPVDAPPVMIPAPPNGATPDISVNSLLKSMGLMEVL
jgi:hypothetical protein